MNALSKTLFLGAILSLSGCALKVTDYRMVYDSTGAELSSMKSGKACLEKGSFTGWTGNASIAEAAKNGGIRTVKLVSHELTSKTDCVIVHGN
ncbi:MAG: TRL-like family protein [Gammaproteobacteria bacterium]|nr:TRL-like family protein [Gammaproteobacteria bacterium]